MKTKKGTIVTITPKIAKAILASIGQFQSFEFDVNGKLLDGRHRLKASVRQ